LASVSVQKGIRSRNRDIATVDTVKRFDEALHYIFLRKCKEDYTQNWE
jgi:hypothetical protein